MKPIAMGMILAGILVAVNPAFAGFINQTTPPVTKVDAKAETTKPAAVAEPPQGKPLADANGQQEPAAASSAPAMSPPKVSVREVGTRPASVYEPKGRGVLIALADVMPVITPKFRVDYADVSRTVPVSWNGSKPWPDVLSDVVAQMPGATATIDWTNAAVTFGLPKSPSPNGAMQPVSERIAARWEVRASDLTLRQTLMRWAKDAGWQVSWEVKYDFPVQLEAAFGGTFENAIEQFTASLRSSEFPLLGCLYEGNRVVRILHHGDNKGCDK